MSIERDNGPIDYDSLTIFNPVLTTETFRAAVHTITNRKILDDFAMARNNLEIQAYLDGVAGRMVVELKTWILQTDRPAIKREFAVPKNWFEHFKKEHFPIWALRAWPVKYDVEVITIQGEVHVCPHINEKLDKRPHLEFVDFLGGHPRREMNGLFFHE